MRPISGDVNTDPGHLLSPFTFSDSARQCVTIFNNSEYTSVMIHYLYKTHRFFFVSTVGFSFKFSTIDFTHKLFTTTHLTTISQTQVFFLLRQ